MKIYIIGQSNVLDALTKSILYGAYLQKTLGLYEKLYPQVQAVEVGLVTYKLHTYSVKWTTLLCRDGDLRLE